MDGITRGKGRIAAGVVSGLLFALALPGMAAAKDAKVYDSLDAAAAGMIAAAQAGTSDAITDVRGD